jgi:predicted DCC family thiol-disulfide oxidoreductase YuxK
MDIILFDGVCNFCNSTVKQIIKYDKKNNFKFASLQSEFGLTTLLNNNMPANYETIILLKDGIIYTKTDAIIEISKQLSGLSKSLFIIKILPKKIRDYFYTLFAKNRYFLFGKKDSCEIPNQQIRGKFIP